MRTGRCLFCDNDIFAGKPLFTGLFVGAAYMPPTVKWRRKNHGQTARKASPKGGRLFPCGVGSPRPTEQYIKVSRSRGGASPARNKTAARKIRVICRGGIYAARGQMAARKSRVNRTGEQCSPLQTCRKITILRKMHKLPHRIVFDSTKIVFIGLQPLLLYLFGCIIES